MRGFLPNCRETCPGPNLAVSAAGACREGYSYLYRLLSVKRRSGFFSLWLLIRQIILRHFHVNTRELGVLPLFLFAYTLHCLSSSFFLPFNWKEENVFSRFSVYFSSPATCVFHSVFAVLFSVLPLKQEGLFLRRAVPWGQLQAACCRLNVTAMEIINFFFFLLSPRLLPQTPGPFSLMWEQIGLSIWRKYL